MVASWQGHRESNPGLETRNLQCYPLHHAPLSAKQAEVPGFEPGSRDSKSLMLSTTPYLQTDLQATAVAHVFDTHAATLPKPRSVALTAMTEGPLQRKLVVEFWSPHIFHLFRIVSLIWVSTIKNLRLIEGFRKFMCDLYARILCLSRIYACHTCKGKLHF